MKRLALAAVLAATVISLSAPAQSAPSSSAKPVVEVAFVLDTTGSMARLIEGAKRKIWSIATSIVEANPEAEIRMGLVAYRDIGDEYVTMNFPLTTDIQDLYAKLLELRAKGGGDWPESVNEALHGAVTKLSWSQGPESYRIVFLVGDAPPHMDYAQDTKYQEVLRIARERDIVVNAVQAGDARDTERVWREIAQMGGGRYIPIPQSGGEIVVIETPYDELIIQLQREMHGTVIPYGSGRKRADVSSRAAQLAAAPKSTAGDMGSFMSKRKKVGGVAEAVTGDGDLVADVASGRQQLAAVRDEELPEEFRAMKPTDRQAHIQQQLDTRKLLSDRMTELVKKRDTYLVEQRSKAPKPRADSFDRAVEETLKSQIRR